MKTEKYNFTTKLHLACATDDQRPIMGCVHFSLGYALASNGYILIKQSLEYHKILNPELLDGQSIHRDNYANIMQFETAEATTEGIACKNKDGRTAFFEYFNRDGKEIPDFDKVIEQQGSRQISWIGVNPKSFEILGKTLYPGEKIRMTFNGIDKAIVCDVPDYEEQIAVVMPIILDASLF